MAKPDAETLLDYVARERATCAVVPFGPVDSAALTQVAMVRSVGVVPTAQPPSALPGAIGALVDRLRARRAPRLTIADFAGAVTSAADSSVTGFTGPSIVRELALMAGNPRFRDMRIVDYASAFDAGEGEGASATQFAAMTFLCEGRLRAPAGASGGEVRAADDGPFAYVAFRGTDATIAGWRENFDMAYATPVPAQRIAADYLNGVVRHLPRRIVVGGHSKGGNLALYAALACAPDVRSRIERVYAHDAPGFKRGTFAGADYAPLSGRIERTVPTESLVGMLFDHAGPERVVRSTARGIDQHSLFTWEIDGDDFAYADKLADSAAFVREVMSDWLSGMTDDEARAVVEAVFAAVEASGAESVLDIFQAGPRIVQLVAESARRTDSASRDVLASAAGKFAAAAARRLGHTVVDALIPRPKA